ncbi:hypothetical protein MPH_03929 [Macrophomina phaseolina MS6]|uniref:Uncharacterized protein n=1 Tax=Macrophomina phaseolina (strain MS6) TaxID=1126212 RepID=K2RVH5_MACPH|nr:hypothetical protein MPH_03929 [Macrophomina phaseolina MS6]
MTAMASTTCITVVAAVGAPLARGGGFTHMPVLPARGIAQAVHHPAGRATALLIWWLAKLLFKVILLGETATLPSAATPVFLVAVAAPVNGKIVLEAWGRCRNMSRRRRSLRKRRTT